MEIRVYCTPSQKISPTSFSQILLLYPLWQADMGLGTKSRGICWVWDIVFEQHTPFRHNFSQTANDLWIIGSHNPKLPHEGLT